MLDLLFSRPTPRQKGVAMHFGIFDHMDRGDLAVGQQYRERLELIAAYDQAGFYAYHLAEHHGTPLGVASAPSVFLAAISQRTKRLRFGPLVYTMSLYHPLRLLEEICMLDQLSDGRLELGIGRGISPIELGFYGVGAEAQERYTEVLEVVLQGLTTGRLNHTGKYHTFHDVPLELSPVQTPHPPLWYGVARPDTTAWAAAQRMNIVTNGRADAVRAITDQYRVEWANTAHGDQPLPMMGMSRHVVIAKTDAAALEVAEPAYARWFTSLLYLWRLKNLQIPLNFPEDFREAHAQGLCLVGSVATVREHLAREIAESGVNYLLCRLAFGNLPMAQSLQSLQYMREEILPEFTNRS
jgi:alkanesulfonate monooxygenase SsuD/methylene tetrahydromethanopterin reductase-like flavin-dependent oxidoreductase (luciferase family)